MTIRHLKIFLTVCEEGGITRAGEKLFMAQPTVSYAIAELEKHYGTKLFDRISKRLYLTDAGTKLLPYAQHIVSMFNEIETGAWSTNQGGTLRIGTSITIGNCLLPGLLSAFKEQNPGVSVKVRVDNSKQIEQFVLENSIDLGLIEGVSHSAQLVNEAFKDDELVLLCAPGHRWAGLEAVPPEELVAEPFLMRERGSGAREVFESMLLLHDIQLEPIWESVSTQAILRAVEKGLGVTVLPLLLVEGSLREGTLVAKPIKGISLKRKFAIIYHRNKFITGPAANFIQQCHSS